MAVVVVVLVVLVVAIYPCLFTMPRRSTSGFDGPGRHRVHQARSAARCSASRMKGELHSTKNRLLGGLAHE